MVDSVEFPRNCVVSLVTPLHEGAVVEVATIGNEGIVGVPQVTAGSSVRAIVSVAGWADRMSATAFREEVERDDGPLRDLVGDYRQALFGQVAQAAACNRLHSNEERLSRWLLFIFMRLLLALPARPG
ncbi:MAG: hypothetical protein JF888_15070 [Candidatus Dormibacteraeota bacterium]|uniref:Uncharacterized protein n=1 Tax=Candidatus Dormiibacter inghamiae TaxID=3127013 RepID=A0A934KGW4_9BACT|nr:hypothetical protein [Candidatus Dormibacteraeota bacterium]MBJ7606915.1 hypothetical protein [Candidatus Dormibacteraeota bacterium]